MSTSTTHAEHQHGHDDPHTHDHDHSHEHPAENYSARTHPEFVVMNVGGGLGGLIVHTDPELHGEEVEVSRSGEDDRRTHKDVLERSAGGRPAFTAVFDGLPAGRYTFWSRNRALARDVEIVDGAVGELDWRTAGERSGS